jgi:hypothetical protein
LISLSGEVLGDDEPETIAVPEAEQIVPSLALKAAVAKNVEFLGRLDIYLYRTEKCVRVGWKRPSRGGYLPGL